MLASKCQKADAPYYIAFKHEHFFHRTAFFFFNLSQRTWEDPTFIHPDAEGCRGDNDPLDVCEIGLKVIKPGVSTESSIICEHDLPSSSSSHNTFMLLFHLGCTPRQNTWSTMYD